MTSFDATWTTPVAIQIGYGERELVTGPAAAMDTLKNRWPGDGMYFEMAVRKCEGYFKRTVTSAEVKDAFIASAIEASILVV